MQTSLGNLVSNLKPDDFHNLKKYYKELQLLLLPEKEFIHMIMINLLNHFLEIQLPLKSECYSQLFYH